MTVAAKDVPPDPPADRIADACGGAFYHMLDDVSTGKSCELGLVILKFQNLVLLDGDGLMIDKFPANIYERDCDIA